MLRFFLICLAFISFASCSNANDDNSIQNNNSNLIENPSNNQQISSETQNDTQLLFSNQNENETKRDINTSLNISLDASDFSELNDFQKALLSCEPFETESISIIGFVDGKCQTKEISNGKNIICNFNKDDLKTIAPFYSKDNVASVISGNYNIDFKMDIPKFDMQKNDDDSFNLNLNMALPKIKIEKSKSPAQIIIEQSCK